MLRQYNRVFFSPYTATLHPLVHRNLILWTAICLAGFLVQYDLKLFQKVLYICMYRHVHMYGRFFQLFSINVIIDHIGLARPCGVMIAYLPD